jgi:hypothetical protein
MFSLINKTVLARRKPMTDKVEPIIEEGWIVKASNIDYIYLDNGAILFLRKPENASFFTNKGTATSILNRAKTIHKSDYEILKVRRTIEIIKEGE